MVVVISIAKNFIYAYYYNISKEKLIGVSPMTTKYLLRNRKAVSTVVAAVLLIAITVVAVAVVWAVVLPMLSPQAKVDIVEVTWEDTDNDQYADKVTIVIQNTGTKTVSLSTSDGARAYGLSGAPYIGLDFTRGNDPNSWISTTSSMDRAVYSTTPAPADYPSLNPGDTVTIVVKLYTDASEDDRDVSWNNGDTVRIKVFLDDGSTHTEEFTVSFG